MAPLKISHKKDGRQRWPHRFHVSRPPPYRAAGSATAISEINNVTSTFFDFPIFCLYCSLLVLPISSHHSLLLLIKLMRILPLVVLCAAFVMFSLRDFFGVFRRQNLMTTYLSTPLNRASSHEVSCPDHNYFTYYFSIFSEVLLLK